MESIENKKRPIYLHFLDRELKRAESAAYFDSLVLEATEISIFESLNYCYCSTSIVYESQTSFPDSVSLILELEKVGLIKLLTNEISFSEFISSRQAMYSHSFERYPMYFDQLDERLFPKDPQIILGSTTSFLRNSLNTWIDNADHSLGPSKSLFPNEIITSISNNLHLQREKAITIDMFSKDVKMDEKDMKRHVGRLISFYYTKRYLDINSGDILTRLPSLQFFDKLSANQEFNSYVITKFLLDYCNVLKVFITQRGFETFLFISCVTHKFFSHIRDELAILKLAFIKMTKENFKGDLNLAKDYYRRKAPSTNIVYNGNIDDLVISIFAAFNNCAIKLSSNNSTFEKNYIMAKEILTTRKRVLIVVATPLEAETFFRIADNNGLSGNPVQIGRSIYWNMGIINDLEIFMLKSGAGSSDVHGSTLTISEGIDDVKPAFVIMVGIAFGLNKEKQQIGNILVSRHIENYDFKKIMDSGVIHRSSKIPSGIALSSRFENASYTFKSAKVEFGLIISGDNLVDSEEFVKKLKSEYPEAIGGEMEGSGLFAANHRKGIVEWILIKGICDWGFDKQTPDKDEKQLLAAKNAFEFLFHTLTYFPL